MCTKEVLLDPRGMSWGSEVCVYRSLEQLGRELPEKLLGAGHGCSSSTGDRAVAGLKGSPR